MGESNGPAYMECASNRNRSHLTYWRVVIHLPVSPEDQDLRNSCETRSGSVPNKSAPSPSSITIAACRHCKTNLFPHPAPPPFLVVAVSRTSSETCWAYVWIESLITVLGWMCTSRLEDENFLCSRSHLLPGWLVGL